MGLFSGWFGGAVVDAARVKALVAAGSPVLDVRTPEEFAAGHVPGARNLPVQGLVARIGELGPRDVPVVVYCRSGARSASAASMLRQAGYAEVIDVGPMSAFPR